MSVKANEEKLLRFEKFVDFDDDFSLLPSLRTIRFIKHISLKNKESIYFPILINVIVSSLCLVLLFPITQLVAQLSLLTAQTGSN